MSLDVFVMECVGVLLGLKPLYTRTKSHDRENPRALENHPKAVMQEVGTNCQTIGSQA